MRNRVDFVSGEVDRCSAGWRSRLEKRDLKTRILQRKKKDRERKSVPDLLIMAPRKRNQAVSASSSRASRSLSAEKQNRPAQS